MTILVGGTQSLAAAAQLQIVWRAFTHAYDRPRHPRWLTEGEANPIVWVDNQNVAFRWEDRRGIVQVVEVNVHTHRARYLSHCATDVALFTISDGSTMAMACDAPAGGSEESDEDEGPFGGHYVTTTDGMAASEGNISGKSVLDEMYDRYLFLVNLRTGVQTRLNIELRAPALGAWWFSPRLSPDGRYEIVDAWAGRPSSEWRAYSSAKSPDFLSRIVRNALQDENSWLGRYLTMLYLVDVRTGFSRPLWDAPTFQLSSRVRMAWSPNSRELVVGPAVLPLASSGEAKARRPVLVTVNVQNGRISGLPVSEQTVRELTGLAWPKADTIEARTREADLKFKRIGMQWRLLGASPLPRRPEMAVRLEMSEGINTPPALYAVDAESGRRRLLLDPNPDLQARLALGVIRYVHWRVKGQSPASGTLYYPTQYQAGHRYPLVIQVCPGSLPGQRARFELYGCAAYPGLGPSPSIYAARMLASRGMFVLNVNDFVLNLKGHAPGTAEAADIRMFAAGARKLGAEGLVDPARVGIAGESLPGLLVEEAITYSNYPYAAAISSAAGDAGYFARLLEPDWTNTPEIRVSGKDLSWFLDHSPTFSADRIRAPLLLEDEDEPGAGILWKWGLYAQLRALHAPVEYYVVPEVDRGSHHIENPGQLMAIKQNAVDWFDFWLNDHEDPASEKAQQYEYWKRLREQRDSLARSRRPPLLRWVATPTEGGVRQHGVS